MSIQDDYFDLEAHFEEQEPYLGEAFNRIWEAFVDMENENEELRPIVSKFRSAIQSLFPQENKDV